LAWTGSHPFVSGLLRGAYFSALPQMIMVTMVLAIVGTTERLSEVLWLYIVTAFSTVVLAGLFPAIGPYVYYAPPERLREIVGIDAGLWHLLHFRGLRDGTFRIIHFASVEGLVTFPSFHAALALVCVRAAWIIPVLRWPIAALNVLVIASTPSIGGHYLIDIVAGVVIAALGIAFSRVRKRHDTHEKKEHLQCRR
jgi:membrane-associated phospholipid phosphatase